MHAQAGPPSTQTIYIYIKYAQPVYYFPIIIEHVLKIEPPKFCKTYTQDSNAFRSRFEHDCFLSLMNISSAWDSSARFLSSGL